MPGPSRRRLLLVSLLACACHSTRTVPLAPKQAGPLLPQSWVVLVGGQRVAVEGGHATADSIFTTRRDGGAFAVPRDSVLYVEQRALNVGRTVGAGAAGIGVVAIAVGVAVVAAALALLAAFGG